MQPLATNQLLLTIHSRPAESCADGKLPAIETAMMACSDSRDSVPAAREQEQMTSDTPSKRIRLQTINSKDSANDRLVNDTPALPSTDSEQGLDGLAPYRAVKIASQHSGESTSIHATNASASAPFTFWHTSEIPKLLCLPVELLQAIMRCLPPGNIFALERTCRRCRSVLSGDPELRYVRLYQLRFPSWRSECNLLDYWRNECRLLDWRDLYHRRVRLEQRWRSGQWRALSATLPGRNDGSARSLLVSADVGTMIAARSGGLLVRIALPSTATPTGSADPPRLCVSTNNPQTLSLQPPMVDVNGRPMELRPSERYTLALVHSHGMNGIDDATLWCSRTLRLLGRIPTGQSSCRLIGRHIIKIHPSSGETAVLEPALAYDASTDQTNAEISRSGADIESEATRPEALHYIEHTLPELGWRWDVIAIHSWTDNRWLLSGGNGSDTPGQCHWAVVDMAATPTTPEASTKAQLVREGRVHFDAPTVHVLAAQLDDHILLLTGSANPRTQPSQTILLGDVAASMSEVVYDRDLARNSTEPLSVEPYRWVYVRSMDGRVAWRRRFSLGCVRYVRLHAALNRVCLLLSSQQMVLLRAKDGQHLGTLNFYGGSLLYHVVGALYFSVDQGRVRSAYRCPRRAIASAAADAARAATHAAADKHTEHMYRRLDQPPIGERGRHRLVLYDIQQIKVVGVYPLPDEASVRNVGTYFSFSVSPAQLAFRDAQSSAVTSLVFDDLPAESTDTTAAALHGT